SRRASRPAGRHATVSPAPRRRVVDGRRPAARGRRALGDGGGGRARGSDGARRADPGDRGAHDGGARRRGAGSGAGADARPGGAGRGRGRTAGRRRGRPGGGGGDEDGERAGRASGGEAARGYRLEEDAVERWLLVVTGGGLLAVACNPESRAPTAPARATSAPAFELQHPATHIMLLRGQVRSGLSLGAAPSSGNGIDYHGGPIIYTQKVAAIYWSSGTIYRGGPAPGTSGPGSADGSVVGFFMSHLGGS